MKPIGHTIIRLDEVESTSTLMLEDSAYLENHGLVVIARHQTGGRGRMGRRWASLPGGQLQFSLVLHPNLPPQEVPLLSLVSGLAVARALEDVLALSPALKWPNDVLLGGGKVCGILVEGARGRGGRPRLVIGIGVNCDGTPGDFPPEVRASLTTLAHETGAPVDKEALLQAILAQLTALHERLTAGDKAALLAEWSRRALLRGHRVRMNAADGAREGEPVGLTAEGCLIIATDDGGQYAQLSGELEWLR